MCGGALFIRIYKTTLVTKARHLLCSYCMRYVETVIASRQDPKECDARMAVYIDRDEVHCCKSGPLSQDDKSDCDKLEV